MSDSVKSHRYPLYYSSVQLVAQMGRNLPVMWETWVQSLGWGDPLSTHSSILASRILWMKEPGGLQSMGLQSYMMEQLSLYCFHYCSFVISFEIRKCDDPVLFFLKIMLVIWYPLWLTWISGLLFLFLEKIYH